ncbi:MAG: helix-turn-helix transcriptional regulator [Pseudomonadota bacterium]
MEGLNVDLDVFLGQRIRLAVEHAGLARPIVSETLTLPIQDLRAMEAGKKRISSKTLYKISKLTGLEISWFFDTNIHGGSLIDCTIIANTQSEDDFPTIIQNLRLNKTLADLCEAVKTADQLGLKTAKAA